MEIGNVIYFCTLTERHGGGRVKRQSFPRRPGGEKKIVITTGPLEFIGVRITPRPALYTSAIEHIVYTTILSMIVIAYGTGVLYYS